MGARGLRSDPHPAHGAPARERQREGLTQRRDLAARAAFERCDDVAQAMLCGLLEAPLRMPDPAQLAGEAQLAVAGSRRGGVGALEGDGAGRGPATHRAEASSTSTSPPWRISNRPASFVEPKRFLRARSSR